MNDTVLLNIQNLSKHYGSISALNNINLTIYAGEVISLLGVNGAGKTTLSSLLATIHPPTSGDILFKGISIYQNMNTYRRAMGFCPQIQNLDRFLTVRENLLFAARYYLFSPSDAHSRTDELLATFDLVRYAHYHVDSLSGGNRQRLLIARALIHNPQLVIFDEPTVGLDSDIRMRVWDYIRTLKHHGITVLITTHYLDEAELLSDRVCVMNRGKLVLVESVSSLKNRHHQHSLEKIFLQLVKEYQEESDDNQ